MLVPPLPEPPGKYISSRGVKHFQRTNPPKNRNKKIALIRGANFSGALFVYVVCARFGTANSSSTVSEALPPPGTFVAPGLGLGARYCNPRWREDRSGRGAETHFRTKFSSKFAPSRVLSFGANLGPECAQFPANFWSSSQPKFGPISGLALAHFWCKVWSISCARFGPPPVPGAPHFGRRAVRITTPGTPDRHIF